MKNIIAIVSITMLSICAQAAEIAMAGANFVIMNPEGVVEHLGAIGADGQVIEQHPQEAVANIVLGAPEMADPGLAQPMVVLFTARTNQILDHFHLQAADATRVYFHVPLGMGFHGLARVANGGLELFPVLPPPPAPAVNAEAPAVPQ